MLRNSCSRSSVGRVCRNMGPLIMGGQVWRAFAQTWPEVGPSSAKGRCPWCACPLQLLVTEPPDTFTAEGSAEHSAPMSPSPAAARGRPASLEEQGVRPRSWGAAYGRCMSHAGCAPWTVSPAQGEQATCAPFLATLGWPIDLSTDSPGGLAVCIANGGTRPVGRCGTEGGGHWDDGRPRGTTSEGVSRCDTSEGAGPCRRQKHYGDTSLGRPSVGLLQVSRARPCLCQVMLRVVLSQVWLCLFPSLLALRP